MSVIYNKTTWIDRTTAINANNMNNIENGIENLDNAIDSATDNEALAIKLNLIYDSEPSYLIWLIEKNILSSMCKVISASTELNVDIDNFIETLNTLRNTNLLMFNKCIETLHCFSNKAYVCNGKETSIFYKNISLFTVSSDIIEIVFKLEENVYSIDCEIIPLEAPIEMTNASSIFGYDTSDELHYEPNFWENNKAPDLSASNFNHMEDGIERGITYFNTLNTNNKFSMVGKLTSDGITALMGLCCDNYQIELVIKDLQKMEIAPVDLTVNNFTNFMNDIIDKSHKEYIHEMEGWKYSFNLGIIFNILMVSKLALIYIPPVPVVGSQFTILNMHTYNMTIKLTSFSIEFGKWFGTSGHDTKTFPFETLYENLPVVFEKTTPENIFNIEEF